MNRLNREKQRQVVVALVEGNSIRATCRMTGVAKNTVVKLLVDLGKVCSEYQDKTLRNLPCKRVQCDEIWAFCYAKAKNVPKEKRGQFGYGDVWTFTAICADSKLVPSWWIGSRDIENATIFMKDLAGRLKNKVKLTVEKKDEKKVQLTTDGHKMYLEAVEDAFGADIDYTVNSLRYMVTILKVRCDTVQVNALALKSTRSKVILILNTFLLPMWKDKSNHAHGDEALYQIDQWILKESGKSSLCGCPSLHALQFLSDSSNPEGYASNGGGGYRSCVVG